MERSEKDTYAEQQVARPNLSQLEAAWMKRKVSARDAALGPGQAIGSWTRAPWSLGRSEHTRSKFSVGACQPPPMKSGEEHVDAIDTASDGESFPYVSLAGASSAQLQAAASATCQ